MRGGPEAPLPPGSGGWVGSDDPCVARGPPASVALVVRLLVILLIIWIVLAVLGISLKGFFWLFWVGVILFVVTLIAWLVRYLNARV